MTYQVGLVSLNSVPLVPLGAVAVVGDVFVYAYKDGRMLGLGSRDEDGFAQHIHDNAASIVSYNNWGDGMHTVSFRKKDFA